MKKLFFVVLGPILIFEVSVLTSATIGQASCPSGFIPVVGNSTLGVNDFCVMQFEAKRVSGRPTSRPEGTPWVDIDAYNAFSACAGMSETGFSGSFGLISNPEWMTIARQIEAQPSNWSGGSVGNGMIPRGHSDDSPSIALAVSDINDPYVGTGNHSAQGEGDGWEQRRRHTLAQNNVQIWDFAGNVYEWVDWIAGDEGFTRAPSNVSYQWREFNDPIGSSITADDLAPSGDYISAHGMGRWFASKRLYAGAALRGGHWFTTLNAGVFSLLLYFSPKITYSHIGLRCVYRP